jgi:WD40 repeat protein
VRIWDLSTDSGLKETLVGCSLVGGSDRLALLRNDRLQIWQFEEVSVVRAIRAGEGDGARCGCFVPGRHTVAAGGPNGVWLFDVIRPNSPIQLDTGDARRPIASPDGRHIYSLVNHQIVDWTLLDGHDATEVASRRIIPIAERPTDIALSKDLQRLVVCSGSEVLVHDPATGLLLRRAEIGRGIESPALTTDGRRALIGNWKGPQNTACLLDLETMKVVRRFPGESVTGVFSSDNRRLAVCTPKQIEVWDIATDALRWSIPREPGQDLAVRSAFSPDGRKLAISASLYDIHLVDAETGQLIVRLPNPSLYMIGDLEFSSDGRLLLAATSSSIVYVWDLDAMQRELQALRLGW